MSPVPVEPKESVPPTSAEGATASSAAEGFPQYTALEIGERRDRLLERLLVILNSAAALGIGPDFTRFGSRSYFVTRIWFAVPIFNFDLQTETH